MPIIDVVKYEGDNSTFIWKHPCEDFNTTTQLIVHESQEAVFFANGQIVDVFGAGRHTLETQNIPLLRKIINLSSILLAVLFIWWRSENEKKNISIFDSGNDIVSYDDGIV